MSSLSSLSTCESILLLLPHVKLNKNEGELYLMSERLGWMVGKKDSFDVTHKYCDIKKQKISAEGKPKVQLQVCLHDGNATAFQFVNPAGQAEQMADRDKVKNLLKLTLQKSKRMVNKDLEEKKLFLSENPQYRQLYMDLVKSNVISTEEFWADHATQFIKQQQDAKNAAQQDVGISASFLADIKPQITDGCAVRYLLTSDVMASIFRTYPSVKQTHLECVPNKITEEEFWKSFFSSHYLHRDKNINATKDLFTDCGKQDEQILRQDSSTTIEDPLSIDLTTLNDVVEEESSSTPLNSMIRRLNHHSISVLKASEQSPGEQAVEFSVPEPTPSKRIRLQEAMSYEDLESNGTNSTVQLNLSIERYLTGPPTTVQSPSGVIGNGSTDGHFGIDANNAFKSILVQWMEGGGERYNPLDDVLDSKTAETVKDQLSNGIKLMRVPQPNPAIHLTSELQKELKELYISLSEILKHFWAAFPPSSPELVQKANRIIDALHKFNKVKLAPYEQKLIQASTSSEAENILKPLRFQIEAAIRKHSLVSYKHVAGSSHEDKFCVLAKIVTHMKTLHQNGADYTLSLEQILDQTNQPDIGMELFDWLKSEALVSNPKIETTQDGRYRFKPPYKVRDREGLLKLLTDFQGYGGIFLEDIQESLPNHEYVLKLLDNEIIFITRPMDKKKILFYNDKAALMPIDFEFQKLWRSVPVDGIEFLMHHGIRSMHAGH